MLNKLFYKNTKLDKAKKLAFDIVNHNHIDSNNKTLADTIKNISAAVYSIYDITLFEEQITSIILLSDYNLNSVLDIKTGEGKTIVLGAASLVHIILNLNDNCVITSSNPYLSQRDFLYLKPLFDNFFIKTTLLNHQNSDFNNLKSFFDTLDNHSVVFSTIDVLVRAFQAHTDSLPGLNPHDKPTKLFFDDLDKISLFLDEVDYQLIDLNLQSFKLNSPVAFDLDIELLQKINTLTIDYIDSLEPSDAKKWNFDYLKQSFSVPEEFEVFISNFFNNDINESQKFRHWFLNAVTVHKFLVENRDFIIVDGFCCIIDTDTGRLKPNVTLGGNLQHSLELIHNLNNPDNTCSYSDNSILKSVVLCSEFVNMFGFISGASGSAIAVKDEIKHFFNLDTLEIPRHLPKLALDADDIFFFDNHDKISWIKTTILNSIQPVLIGVNDPVVASMLFDALKNTCFSNNKKINVLTSSNHQKEEDLISLAGQPNSVTITTPVAGRGADIKLHPDVANLGLLVIGFEKSVDARIDSQLRGRCGRQGQNGKSVFLLSNDDKLATSIPFLKTLSKKLLNDSKSISDPSLSNMFNDIQFKIGQESIILKNNNKKFDDFLVKLRKHHYHYLKLLKNIQNDDFILQVKKWNVDMNFNTDLDSFDLNDDLGWHSLKIIAVELLQKHYGFWLQNTEELLKGLQWRGRAKKDPFDEFVKDSSLGFDRINSDFKIELFDIIKTISFEQNKDFNNDFNDLSISCYQNLQNKIFNLDNPGSILFHSFLNIKMEHLSPKQQQQLVSLKNFILSLLPDNNKSASFLDFQNIDFFKIIPLHTVLSKIDNDNQHLSIQSILDSVTYISADDLPDDKQLIIVNNESDITAVFDKKLLSKASKKIVLKSLNDSLHIASFELPNLVDKYLSDKKLLRLSGLSGITTSILLFQTLKNAFNIK